MPFKQLRDLFDEHFLSPEKEVLIQLFEKYDLINCIDDVFTQLNDQLLNVAKNDSTIIPVISSLSSNFLVTVNSKVIQILDHEEKNRIQKAIAEIGVRVILSIVREFTNKAHDILNAIRQSLHITARSFGYNHNHIVELTNIQNLTLLANTLNGEKQAEEIKEIKSKTSPKLIWTKKAHLDYLTHELKERNWIKSQKEFTKLFDRSLEGTRVRWDFRHKYELAHLLHVLAKQDFIRPKKGYFSFPEQFIVDFTGEMFKKNTLKKLSSKINDDPYKYAVIIEEINNLILSISNKKRDQ